MYDDQWHNPQEMARTLFWYFGMKSYVELDSIYEQDSTMSEEWYIEILRWLDYYAEG